MKLMQNALLMWKVMWINTMHNIYLWFLVFPSKPAILIHEKPNDETIGLFSFTYDE
jgi:hypothetical protein